MVKLNELAKNYESQAKISNIADMEFIQANVEVLEEKDAEFPYYYIDVNGQRFKVPKSVLNNLKAILEENPNLQKFKVKKTGEGMDTRYTVIPLA